LLVHACLDSLLSPALLIMLVIPSNDSQLFPLDFPTSRRYFLRYILSLSNHHHIHNLTSTEPHPHLPSIQPLKARINHSPPHLFSHIEEVTGMSSEQDSDTAGQEWGPQVISCYNKILPSFSLPYE